MSQIDLAQIDRDGAIQETANEAEQALVADGDTRADFFKKAGMAGGAVMGGGALLAALAPEAAFAAKGGRPPASFGNGDIGILNYALTLEYLEAEFYEEAKRNNEDGGPLMPAFLTGQEALFLNTVNRDEAAHVKYLKKILGNKAIKKPKFDFRDTTSDRDKFLRTAFKLENTGVGAYSGQALNIKDPAVIAGALSIVTIEARHASVIGLLLKDSREGIVPDGPFDKPLSAKQVLKGVKKLNFIKNG